MSGGTFCKTPRMDTGWICKEELTAAISHPDQDKRDIPEFSVSPLTESFGCITRESKPCMFRSKD
jgi:hypothetical protein